MQEVPDFYNQSIDQSKTSQQIESSQNTNNQDNLSPIQEGMLQKFLDETHDNTKDKINSLLNGFKGNESELIRYLEHRRNNLDTSSDSALDDFLQMNDIIEATKSDLGNLTENINSETYQQKILVENRELNDELPQSISFGINNGYYYHEGIGPDHNRKLDRFRLSHEFNNGLQQGETGIIKLISENRKYSYEVSVKYQNDGLIFTYRGLQYFQALSKGVNGRNQNIIFGNRVQSGKRGTYLKINVNLSWRD